MAFSGLAGVAGASASLGGCSGHQHPTMTARNSHSTEKTEPRDTTKAVSKFWQECDRYHDLEKQFQRNIKITHPDKLTGRSGYYSCGCAWCAQEVKYYEYVGPDL
jgi:hypothetical protein